VAEALRSFADAGRWEAEISATVLPDDADRLLAALSEARDMGCDAVFTTGGTGVGPRDVTPDVVASFCDKIIPGIMDAIRIKYGARNPKALLSRSIAGVAGRTLVFALPGSVRAVDEYMTEILAVLEHLVLTVHGVDAH
jgi:molybdenum cofactor synthesis domain-containing protein